MEIMKERIFKEEQFEEIVAKADGDDSIPELMQLLENGIPPEVFCRIMKILVFRAFENGYAYKIAEQEEERLNQNMSREIKKDNVIEFKKK